jgi:hypothetical protein
MTGTASRRPDAEADAGREIVVSRTIAGPRRLVFAAYTDATEIALPAVFRTREQRQEVVERYHAIEGGQQTLSRLAAYLATLPAGA